MKLSDGIKFAAMVSPGTVPDLPSPWSAARSSELGPIAAICLIWGLLAIAIDPRGEFALNDDWAHVLPVKALVESGSLRLTDWNCVSLVALLAWGALFCLPSGYSITLVRVSALMLSLIGLVGFYLLLRRFGAGRAVATLGALTLGANPCYLSLSYTFMTDVPYVALLVIAVLLLVSGLEADSWRTIWAGLAVALIAVFVRQLALAIFFGFAVAYPFRRGFDRGWVTQALLPAAGATALLKIYERWLTHIGQLPASYANFHILLFSALTDLAKGHPKLLLLPLWRSFVLVIYLGLTMLPLLVMLGPALCAPLSRRGRWILGTWVTAFALLTTAILAATGHLMPVVGNVFYDLGVGIKTLPGTWPSGLSRWVWVALTSAAAVGGAISLAALFALVRSLFLQQGRVATAAASTRWRAVFLVATSVISFGPTAFTYGSLFDRYIMGLLPLAMLLVWEGISRGQSTTTLRGPATTVGVVLMLGELVFSTAATHDYLAWNRVRWAAGSSWLRERGLALEDLDAGFEFNNYFVNEQRLNWTRSERDASKTPEERPVGGCVTREQSPYRISVSPLAKYEVCRTLSVPSWLPSSPRKLYVVARLQPRPAATTSISGTVAGHSSPGPKVDQ